MSLQYLPAGFTLVRVPASGCRRQGAGVRVPAGTCVLGAQGAAIPVWGVSGGVRQWYFIGVPANPRWPIWLSGFGAGGNASGNGFTETGAGAIGLRVQGATSALVESLAGATFDAGPPVGLARPLALDVRAAWA